WLARDAAARLAVRNHLPLAERADFGKHKTAKALYGAVVTCYSSPATAALGRLILPCLFPELSAFAIVEDLITHLRTSDTRYRAALKAEFLDKNPPPMYITLYFLVNRLLDSLRAVRDHFLALDPTYLTVDLLEKHLLAAETSIVAVGAARGTPRTPFSEGCSPSPLAPSYASAAVVYILGTEEVGAASDPSGKRRSGKGKGGKSGGGGSGCGGAGGGGGGGGGGGSGGGSGGFGCGGGGSGGSGGGGGGDSGSGGGGSGGGGSGGSQGGAVHGVAGVGVEGVWSPLPILLLSFPLLQLPLGGGRVWGSQGSGTGVAGVRPTSSRPATSPLFPPLLLLQQCGGEGEGEGEGMEWVTSQRQPASSLSLPPLLWSGGESKGLAEVPCCRTCSAALPAVVVFSVCGVPLQVVSFT
ncbi:unnamed protein product, partial [Closterium sp. NIES-54]